MLAARLPSISALHLPPSPSAPTSSPISLAPCSECGGTAAYRSIESGGAVGVCLAPSASPFQAPPATPGWGPLSAYGSRAPQPPQTTPHTDPRRARAHRRPRFRPAPQIDYPADLAKTGSQRKRPDVPDTPPTFLTIPECCDLLRLSERSVYDMARNGRLPGAAKVGGKWRVNRSVLMDWLATGGDHSATGGVDG